MPAWWPAFLPHWLPSVVLGVIVAIAGRVLMQRNKRAWYEQQAADTGDEFDRRHFHNRYVRRQQVAGMVIAVGVMLFGDIFIWNLGPAASAIYWIAVILMCCWITLIGLGDLTSVQSHSKVALKRVEKERRQLEADLAELKRRLDDGASR